VGSNVGVGFSTCGEGAPKRLACIDEGLETTVATDGHETTKILEPLIQESGFRLRHFESDHEDFLAS
jgi:hypothetical protein